MIVILPVHTGIFMKHQVLLFCSILLVLISCKAHYSGTAESISYYSPGQTHMLAVDSAIVREIQPYQAKLNEVMNDVLAFSEQHMEKGKPESTLGNFVADLCFEIGVKKYKTNDQHSIDFCVLNNGGLRSSLPAGAITRKNVFELMPFENELVVLTLPGKAVESLLQYIAGKGGVPVSNLRMKISKDVFSEAVINGQEFNSSLEYKILTSDYLASGGDGMDMFKQNTKSEPVNCKVRDAIIEYLEMINQWNEKVISKKDGRISE